LATTIASTLAVTTSLSPFFITTVGVVGVATLAGCNKPKPLPPPPPPPPPVAREPDRPEPANIAGVMAAIGADERVQFPQERAPENEDLAKAVAQFAGALAKGSSREFGSFLDASSRPILDDLVADGRWDDGTSQIEAVRIVHMTTMMTERDGAMVVNAAQFVLAIQEPGEAYTLGWRAAKDGDAWQFEAVPTSDATKSRASEWDADSMSAFSAPQQTGGPSRARPGAGGLDSMLASAEPITRYCFVEVSRRLGEASGAPTGQIEDALGNMGAEERSQYDQGKAEYEGGARPTEAQAEPIFQFVGMMSGLLRMASAMQPGAQNVSQDQIATIVSEVLGMDVATVRTKLAASAASAPDLTNLIPGMPRPDNGPPPPRPGTTRRNTPAGPIDIPTETPSSDPGGG